MTADKKIESIFKPSVLSGKELAEITTSIESMGELEQFSSSKMDSLDLIYSGMSNKKLLNTFRDLRTKLLQKASGNNFTCLITSVCPRGGSSYIAKNLGAAFALDQTKTSVLIDANLYKPSLEELIIGEPNFGLTCHLSKKTVDISDIVYATGVPRLRVIPIGANVEAAAEYFSTEKMVAFVSELKSRYEDRFIFIDAPPIGSSSEASILLNVVDFVILVVPYGKVSINEIKAAVNGVDPEMFAGLVFNN